jgi:hypothetical protein
MPTAVNVCPECKLDIFEANSYIGSGDIYGLYLWLIYAILV